MTTCFGYTRVSTVKQGEGVSLEAQRDEITRFAARKGITISEWFSEKETAAKSGRPLFDKMVRQLKRGKADGFVVHKIDRSARNFRDWARIADLADQGIGVHFATEPLDFRSRGGRLTADSRYGNKPFGIRLADRMQHIYILGQTGTGKSTLLLNLMKQDLLQGHGFCLVDPHGDLARQIAGLCIGPDEEGAIIWNAADPDCPYGYNPMTRASEKFRPLIASGLIDTLKKQWADAWGARMEHLLRYSILALLEQPRTDIRDIMRLFLDSGFRKEVLAQVTDEQVLLFWQKEFPAMNYKTAFDGVAPIANKLGAFLAHPVVRRALCEPEQPLRLRKIMDDGQILIVNLAKGQLGSDIANVLGGMIVSGLAHAAYSRHTTPEAERRPFFLYVDEFHSFTTDAMAEMLSELRKYGLSLTLANQYFGQIEGDVLDALLGNAGTLIAFRVSPMDAPTMSRFFDGIDQRDLISMPNYRMLVRLMVQGERTKAFTAWAMWPVNVFGSYKSKSD